MPTPLPLIIQLTRIASSLSLHHLYHDWVYVTKPTPLPLLCMPFNAAEDVPVAGNKYLAKESRHPP